MTSAPVLVVDVANVMGSRADGWWRDRAGAVRRLADEISATTTDDSHVVLVLEGAARDGVAATTDAPVHVAHAPGAGDDTVVDRTRALLEQGRRVTVVTADRALRDRVLALDAACRGPHWLLDQLT